MKKLLILLLRVYQVLFTPHRSIRHCRYVPGCSDYAMLSIEKYGALRGLLKACWRVCRCNPFTRGGIDMP